MDEEEVDVGEAQAGISEGAAQEDREAQVEPKHALARLRLSFGNGPATFANLKLLLPSW